MALAQCRPMLLSFVKWVAAFCKRYLFTEVRVGNITIEICMAETTVQRSDSTFVLIIQSISCMKNLLRISSPGGRNVPPIDGVSVLDLDFRKEPFWIYDYSWSLLFFSYLLYNFRIWNFMSAIIRWGAVHKLPKTHCMNEAFKRQD